MGHGGSLNVLVQLDRFWGQPSRVEESSVALGLEDQFYA
jgi:hypothetical protein